VIQLYIRNTAASVEQPVRELKGFARVQLAPGETKHVEFPLGFDELNFYNAEIKRTVEPTTYKIWVGGSSLASAEKSLAGVVCIQLSVLGCPMKGGGGSHSSSHASGA